MINVAIQIFEWACGGNIFRFGSKLKCLTSRRGNVLLKSHYRAVKLRIKIKSSIRLSASLLGNHISYHVSLKELFQLGFCLPLVLLLHKVIVLKSRSFVIRVFVSNYIRDVSFVLLSTVASRVSLIYSACLHHLKLKFKAFGHVDVATVYNTFLKYNRRPLKIAMPIGGWLDILKGNRIRLRLPVLSVEGLLLDNELLDIVSSILIIILLLHHIHVHFLFSVVMKAFNELGSFFLIAMLRIILLYVLINCFLDPSFKFKLPLSSKIFSLIIWFTPFKFHLSVISWGKPLSFSLSIGNFLLSSLNKQEG